MADFTFDYTYFPPARRELHTLPNDDQAEIERLVAVLCRDPFVDNTNKYVLIREPLELYLFTNGVWSVAYRIVDGSVIEIRAIARTRA